MTILELIDADYLDYKLATQVLYDNGYIGTLHIDHVNETFEIHTNASSAHIDKLLTERGLRFIEVVDEEEPDDDWYNGTAHVW